MPTFRPGPAPGSGPGTGPICRSGRRSRHVAGLLREEGSYAVDALGGMQACARRGLPVQDAEGAGGTVI
ncbi:hypothetical protein [Streptomyces sp. NPDC055400]